MLPLLLAPRDWNERHWLTCQPEDASKVGTINAAVPAARGVAIRAKTGAASISKCMASSLCSSDAITALERHVREESP